LINAPRVPSNGLSHHVASYDLTRFVPAVQKLLQKLQSLHNSISIEPIIQKIGNWESPLEQAFYVACIYLINAKLIDPRVRIVEQYPIIDGRKAYWVDFRLSLIDELRPELPPITMLVECDSHQFHDPILEASTERCRRARVIEQQCTKVYRFSGEELLKNPTGCVRECVRGLEALVIARRELLRQAFL
jgi:hypothetical protein